MFSRVKSLLTRQSRGGIIFRTASISLLTRCVGIVLNLATIPMVYSQLGAEKFGIWAVCLALAGLLTLADGGVSNSVISPISKANSVGDTDTVRRLIASALLASIFSTAILGLFCLAALTIVDWQWVLGLSDATLAHEGGLVLVALGASYAVSFPASTVRNTRLGLMQGASANLWDLAGTLATFAALVSVYYFNGGLVYYALAWGLPNAMLRWAQSIYFFAVPGRSLRPGWQHVDSSLTRMLFIQGGGYLSIIGLQILGLQMDLYWINRLIGADQVADYAILQRLFAQPLSLIVLVTAAQWPAYADALGKNEYDWVRKNLRKTLILTTSAAAAACFAIAVFHRQILSIWLGQSLEPSWFLVMVLAVLGVLICISNVMTYFYLAAENYKRLLKTYCALLALNLPLSVVFITHWGNAGAAIASSLSTIITIIIPGLLGMTRKHFLT